VPDAQSRCCHPVCFAASKGRLWWSHILAHKVVEWRLPVILALFAYGVVMNEVEDDLLVFFWELVLSMPNRAGSQGKGRVSK
jgi:hypothetical protein